MDTTYSAVPAASTRLFGWNAKAATDPNRMPINPGWYLT